MSESPIQTPPGDSTTIPSSQLTTTTTAPPPSPVPIEVEFVSEEEMALFESACLAATKSFHLLPPSSPPMRISRSFSLASSANVRSIESITINSKRRLSDSSSSSCQGIERVVKDIQDLEEFGNSKKKRNRKIDSLLHRFRRNRALSVIDIVSSEWCQKKMEFVLVRGKPKATEAMKAGIARHAKLEKEVVQKVEVHVKEIEDSWALKLMNFILGVNQLLFDGLTRELPLVGFVQGVWMVGVIDEIRLPTTESVPSPFLVENKTRSQATLPAEAQKRNGMLQLMCYKYLWDSIVSENFPANRFYTFFGLDSHYILCEQVQDIAATSGFPAKTLDDIVMRYRNTCDTLSTAHDELLLRYEFQGDESLLGEEKFQYDFVWLMSQLKCSLEFWLGEREPNYVSEEERWKCRSCKFASICPNMESTTECAETELQN